MIIRKPYAFLIKNFKRIHIFLLIATLYAAYKLFDISGYVNKYIQTTSYSYQDPVGNHITFLFKFVLFLIIVGTISIIILLYHKKKPWKIYLIPLIEYVFAFFVLNMIQGFFTKLLLYDDLETTDLRMSKDLLMIIILLQLPAIIVFVVRVLGLDIKKFEFNMDKEFLELSEKDREEFEINIQFDKNSIIRLWKKMIRNIRYFYDEHTKICRFTALVLMMIVGWRLFFFVFVTNRFYFQGQNYNFNGFTMKINHVYWTNKNYTGDIISTDSSFIIVDLTVRNNWEDRNLEIDKFHLKYYKNDYITTRKTYTDDFKDLGTTYTDVKKLKRNESFHFIIIYKVKSKVRKSGFSFYYQESSGYLRNFKIFVKDISKITDRGTYKLGKEINFKTKELEDNIIFDSYDLVDKVSYSIRDCTYDDCMSTRDIYKASSGYKVLSLSFSSDDIEGKKLFDISKKYGKIQYEDVEGEKKEVSFQYPFAYSYLGKYLYTLVPEEIEDAKKIQIVYSFRNDRYTYQVE